MKLDRHPLTFWLLCAFVLAGGVLAFSAWSALESGRAKTIQDSRTAATRAATEMVDNISRQIAELKVAAVHLVDQVNTGELTADNTFDRICDELTPQSTMALSVAWLPGFVPESVPFEADDVVYFRTGYRSPDGCERYDGTFSAEQVVSEDHGRISAWYDMSAATAEPAWFGEPYYSPVSLRYWCCGFSVPFMADGKVAGVVSAELMLDRANRAIFDAETSAFEALPDDASFGMLVSRDGLILSHPDPSVVADHQRLSDWVPELDDPATYPALPRPALASGPAVTSDVRVLDDVHYSRSGQDFSIFLAPVGDTGWWVAVVLDQDAIDRGVDIQERVETLTVRLVLAAAIFLFGVILLVTGTFVRGNTRLWIDSLTFTIICLALVGWRLDYSLEHTAKASPGELALKTRASVAKEVLHFSASHHVEPKVIPTGVFVQSTEFTSANNVTVTGLLWQKFAHDLPDHLRPDTDAPEPGFVFPEAEHADIDLMFVRGDDRHTVMGWKYRAVLRQGFNYRHYPFDLETIWIRLWPAALGEGVILAPDLDAYETLVPELKPGLEENDFVLGGWDIRNSYFSYRHNRYNTHLGTGNFVGQSQYPELYFNLGLSRQFLNAFIMNFITLSVVAFLLFAVLFTIKPGDEASDLLGFNVSTVLGFCAALFFVVIISHTSLRQEIASPTLVYLEYYFFALYVAFLGVSVNAILAASRRPPEWIRRDQNVYARLLFWPLLSATILVVTLVVFG